MPAFQWRKRCGGAGVGSWEKDLNRKSQGNKFIMDKIYYFWKFINRNDEWGTLWALPKAGDKPWNLSFISSSWLRCRKDPGPSKRATSALKHTQHFLLDGCMWTTPTELGRNKSLFRKHMTGGWTRNKMGLLCVDRGIKCVASINSYLPIPLLFYGQSWIMLSSMNECGGKKINGTFPASMWPGLPLWSLICFWCLVETVHLLGLMMSETLFHAFLKPPIFLLTEKWLKVVLQHLFLKAIHELGK